MQYRPGMTQNRLLTVGLIGVLAAAVCCLSPILIGLLGAVGLSALTGYLDYLLVPAIVIFAALTIHALVRRKAV